MFRPYKTEGNMVWRNRRRDAVDGTRDACAPQNQLPYSGFSPGYNITGFQPWIHETHSGIRSIWKSFRM